MLVEHIYKVLHIVNLLKLLDCVLNQIIIQKFIFSSQNIQKLKKRLNCPKVKIELFFESITDSSVLLKIYQHIYFSQFSEQFYLAQEISNKKNDFYNAQNHIFKKTSRGGGT